MQTAQDHLEIIIYATFRGQTEWIIGSWRIEIEGMNEVGSMSSQSRDDVINRYLFFRSGTSEKLKGREPKYLFVPEKF